MYKSLVLEIIQRRVTEFSSTEIPVSGNKWFRRASQLRSRSGYLLAWQFGWMIGGSVPALLAEAMFRLLHWQEQTVNMLFLWAWLTSAVLTLARWLWMDATPGGVRIIKSACFYTAYDELVVRESFDAVEVVKSTIITTMSCSLIMAVPLIVWYLLVE